MRRRRSRLGRRAGPATAVTSSPSPPAAATCVISSPAGVMTAVDSSPAAAGPASAGADACVTSVTSSGSEAPVSPFL